MQPSHLPPSLSRRQLLTAIAAGATCVATGAVAAAVLDGATVEATAGLPAPETTAAVPFVLSF